MNRGSTDFSTNLTKGTSVTLKCCKLLQVSAIPRSSDGQRETALSMTDLAFYSLKINLAFPQSPVICATNGLV